MKNKESRQKNNIPNLSSKTLIKNYEKQISLLEQEIEERKKLEKKLNKDIKEKEGLLREVLHRIKNNMQLISSLLRLQSRFAKDEEIQNILKETISRIKSITLVHDRIYQTGNLFQIDFGSYIRHLTDHITHLFFDRSKNIKIEVETGEINLSMGQSVSCGLIITELVTNSLKHAFPGGKKGKISIKMNAANKKFYELILADSGVGIPESIDINNPDTLGLLLVKDSVKQLNGKISVHIKNGTTFKIIFPIT